MNLQKLHQEITKTQQQLQRLQEQLEAAKAITIETAPVGTVLFDGTVVIARYEDSVLLAAPKSTEVKAEWTPEFKPVFDSLKKEGFIPSQWYVPSPKELQLAYDNCRNQFSSPFYWSSTSACYVNFNYGIALNTVKTFTSCVRAVRRIVL